MDEQYMQQALVIAQYASGRTSPNPMVGAVIVKDGKVVGQGWHRKAGTPHAEIHALRQAGDLANGATMYVTLEPCSHHGRTAPCADTLIQAGIKRVVIAMGDPNPLVAGKGIEKLRQAGIEVEEGILAAKAAKLNEIFIKWVSCKLPFVALKTAMTLDGKIATVSGHSKWITGTAARQRVHVLRDTYDGIIAGIGTVLADDPELTTRLTVGGRNPVRIIIDSQARIPLHAKVVSDRKSPTILAVTDHAPSKKIDELRERGVEVLVVNKGPGKVDLRKLFSLLAEREITSLLIEGGASINSSVLEANLADKVYWFVAPKIVGGNSALGPVAGNGINHMDDAKILENLEFEKVGEDMLITAYLRSREGRNVYRTCGRIGEG